jgi:N4-gp56 family major capsid protein
MSQTNVPFGSPLAVKKWSKALAVDFLTTSYFNKKFVGTSDTSVIQQKTELQSDSGDTIQFDLSVQLRGRPVSGDNRAEGREESLRFFSDQVIIDQLRKPVSAGGKMSRKRTVHNLRQIARARLSEFWAEYFDQTVFIYLSGARGINEDFYEGTDYTGHAGNPIQTPDAAHIVFGGSATSVATITTADGFSRSLVEKVSTKAKMMRALDINTANLKPVMVEGNEHYCIVMSPFQEHQLRNDVGASNWLDLQKAAAGAEGSKSKIFRGGLGMIDNIILHSHKSVIRFNNYGAGSNLAAARALFMGRQAAVVAYGTPGGKRLDWEENMRDYGNEPTILAGMIFGLKKARFNGRDFGVVAMDTYAPNPNPA